MLYKNNWICNCPEMLIMQHEEMYCVRCRAVRPGSMPREYAPRRSREKIVPVEIRADGKPKGSARFITINGVTKSCADWERELKIPNAVLWYRYHNKIPLLTGKVYGTARLVTIGGETKSFEEWRKHFGYTHNKLAYRLKYGLELERPHFRKTLTIDGRTQTVMEWAKELHIKYGTLWFRVKNGLDPRAPLQSNVFKKHLNKHDYTL